MMPFGVNSIFPLCCRYVSIVLSVLWFTFFGSLRFSSAVVIISFASRMVSSTICTVASVGLCLGCSNTCVMFINMGQSDTNI